MNLLLVCVNDVVLHVSTYRIEGSYLYNFTSFNQTNDKPYKKGVIQMKKQERTKIKAKKALKDMVEDGIDKAAQTNQLYDKPNVYVKNKEREERIEQLRQDIIDDYNNNNLEQ